MPAQTLDPRVTERRNPRTADIDLASPAEIVALMHAEDRGVADAVFTQRDAIADTIAAVEQAFRHGHRLFYIGAGTSGRLGVLDASECPPTFGTDPAMVVGLIAGGDRALRVPIEGAEDDPDAGRAAMEAHAVSAGDVVVGIADAVFTQRDAIADTIAAVEQAFRHGHRLFYIGAGTSGRLGVLDASECPPTFGTDPAMVVGLIAGGDRALRVPIEGAEDDPDAGRAAMDAHAVSAGDVVVGIAASGTTPFVRGALEHAREHAATTALIACTEPPDVMRAVADHLILPIVGPEVLTGSTRLKAGTATKMVCNMITTGAMIRIGKSYGNLMVDLRATNAKLSDRAERIVVEVTACSREDARALLAQANGQVKLAIVMHALGIDASTAQARLDAVGGVIRRVVTTAPPPVTSA